jgi:hypothetical protein
LTLIAPSRARRFCTTEGRAVVQFRIQQNGSSGKS